MVFAGKSQKPGEKEGYRQETHQVSDTGKPVRSLNMAVEGREHLKTGTRWIKQNQTDSPFLFD
jgi:hypothetical protein